MSFHIWENAASYSAPQGKKMCLKCKQEMGHHTQECPEREISEEEKQKILDRSLDYKEGKWRHYMKVF